MKLKPLPAASATRQPLTSTAKSWPLPTCRYAWLALPAAVSSLTAATRLVALGCASGSSRRAPPGPYRPSSWSLLMGMNSKTTCLKPCSMFLPSQRLASCSASRPTVM